MKFKNPYCDLKNNNKYVRPFNEDKKLNKTEFNVNW